MKANCLICAVIAAVIRGALGACRLGWVVCALGVTGAGAAPPTKPNILFLFTDDQAAMGAGCYGNSDII